MYSLECTNLEFGVLMSFAWLAKYNKGDVIWLPGLGLRMLCNFCFLSWNASLGPWWKEAGLAYGCLWGHMEEKLRHPGQSPARTGGCVSRGKPSQTLQPVKLPVECQHKIKSGKMSKGTSQSTHRIMKINKSWFLWATSFEEAHLARTVLVMLHP